MIAKTMTHSILLRVVKGAFNELVRTACGKSAWAGQVGSEGAEGLACSLPNSLIFRLNAVNASARGKLNRTLAPTAPLL